MKGRQEMGLPLPPGACPAGLHLADLFGPGFGRNFEFAFPNRTDAETDPASKLHSRPGHDLFLITQAPVFIDMAIERKGAHRAACHAYLPTLLLASLAKGFLIGLIRPERHLCDDRNQTDSRAVLGCDQEIV